MAGLPWLKVYTDLPRDPRSLVLGDMLGDPRAWTYVVQFRMYLADNAPSGRLSGLYADVAFERCAGWAGERGRLLKSMRDAGFVRAGPARDGEGTEIEDLDWAREQGAHVAKVERDAKKPRGNAHNVISPSRDIGGTGAGPASTPRGESRELRVESREEATASQETADAVPGHKASGQPMETAANGPSSPAIARNGHSECQGSPPFRLEAQKPGKAPRKPSAAEALFERLQATRRARCEDVGEPWIDENWPYARRNRDLGLVLRGDDAAKQLFETAWGLYLADEAERAREPAWSLSYFMNSGVRAKYETRAAREAA